MKHFTITKVGYSTGIYGCSGEYFVCVYVTPKKQGAFHFKGMYGAEERIEKVMLDKGFRFFYVPSRFGKLTGTDKNGFMPEYEAIDYINNGFYIIDKKQLAKLKK